MSVPLDYKDTVQLVLTTIPTGGYATEVIAEIQEVGALFIANTGQAHSNFRTAITSDAEVYLDPENEFVIENHNRLEGMMIIANPFGEAEEQAWYRITAVIVGQDKLLDNQIDNINCQLKKSTEIQYVS